jgi:hypothetical protein
MIGSYLWITGGETLLQRTAKNHYYLYNVELKGQTAVNLNKINDLRFLSSILKINLNDF